MKGASIGASGKTATKLVRESLKRGYAVVAVPIAMRRLKATDLVASLAKVTAANGVKRLVFPAGEVTAVRTESETYTLRQRLMLAVIPRITWFTPYSMTWDWGCS